MDKSTKAKVSVDNNIDELELKQLLVDLEDRHKHLEASVEQLSNVVKSKELEMKELLSQRELALLQQQRPNPYIDSRTRTNDRTKTTVVGLNYPKLDNNEEDPAFTRKVDEILSNLLEKAEAISSLISL